MVKRFVVPALIACIAAASLAAQEADAGLFGRMTEVMSLAIEDPDYLAKALDISVEEAEQLQELQRSAREERRLAKAEIEVLRAQISRILVENDPDLAEVEKLLREALEWELASRMTEIRTDVRMREILGDRQWARFVRSERLLEELQSMRWRELAQDQLRHLQDEFLEREKDFVLDRLESIRRRMDPEDRELRRRIEELERELSRRGRR